MADSEEDTLSRVAITEAVTIRWDEAAKKVVRALISKGLYDPSLIPDELARVRADGSLEIYVDLPTGERISIMAAPDEWAWIGPINH
jgi:hypothetical protein